MYASIVHGLVKGTRREVAGSNKMPGHFIFPLSLFLALTLGKLSFSQTTHNVSRDDFPPDFVFGAGTSAYQVEGAAAEDGRTPSIWDTYAHKGKMPDKSTADVASDGYHKYKEDVKLMSDTRLEAYKFSISWSRLIPNGRGAINPKGLEYYNNLIGELVTHGIQPHVALYHQDLPQALEDEYGGWLSLKIVDDFTAYADACFREFGDQVTHWTTFVEPNAMAQASYDSGVWPPNRCSNPFGVECSEGDSTTEPYTVIHNILLAHASVFALYRMKYQALQHGWIGLNIYSFWCIPLTNATADAAAVQRVQDFYTGWIMHPLVFGDYPKIMKRNAGSRLPSFTKEESEQVKDSFDFIGLNYYTSVYVGDRSNDQKNIRDFTADISAVFTVSKNETPTPQFIPTQIKVYPTGLHKYLEYLKQAYGNPPVYIQENGYGIGANDTFNDTDRIDYLNGFMGSTLDAIKNGSDVRGYFVWSFMDVFEFLGGYTSHYGLYHVDFEDEERRRKPKLSALWYANFLKKTKKRISIGKPNLCGTS